ncbi:MULTISPECIES: CDP-diacylglycerol--glycerol-3-phosphate 3-phosphatidyltransferase [unclassified Janibacter]|uniref:CDP-diacylglycerol--glycerol-3-phosphate 3-phosphatidyltransferase n=1 Tax=unclassified Janibacter TaxID=2649294 RepID=UPI003CFC64A2
MSGTAPVTPVEPSPWNLPNALTVLRIILVPVFGWLLLSHGGDSVVHRWLACAVFVGAMITDKVDGDIARSRGLVTNFGKVADPIADKALSGMAFIGLSVLDVIPWWMTVLVLVREWGITLMRFAVIRHGVMPAGRGGKLKTTLQAVALGALSAPLWTLPLAGLWEALAWITLVAAVVVTVVTGVDYVLKAYRLREGSDRTAAKRARSGGSTGD